MYTEWMGRYRGVIAALVRHGNVVARTLSDKVYHEKYDFYLGQQEWQTLEYLLEHSEDLNHMAQISNQLGMSTSSFSKNVSVLVKYGLVEKYKMEDNRKNIILRISDKGRAFYDEYAQQAVIPMFGKLLGALSTLSDEQLDALAEGIWSLSGTESEQTKKEKALIKVD